MITIAVLLLAGAALNIAVAWGCALWLPWPQHQPGFQGFTRDGLGSSEWLAFSTNAVGFTRITSTWLVGNAEFGGRKPNRRAEDIVPTWATFARPGASPQNTYRILDARGWPRVSLWSGIEAPAFLGPTAIVGNVVTVTRGYLLPAERSKRTFYIQNLRVVPFAPVWHGFVVDSLFYAVVLWPLTCGPFALRRLLRRRRGLCPACAYPMGDSAVCAECGRPLPRRAVA